MENKIRFKDKVKKTFTRNAVILMIFPLVVLTVILFIYAYISKVTRCSDANKAICYNIDNLYNSHINFIENISENAIQKVIYSKDHTEFFNEAYSFINQKSRDSIFILFNKERELVASNMKKNDEMQFTFLQSRLLFSILDSNIDIAKWYTFYNADIDSPVNIVAKAIVKDNDIMGYLCILIKQNLLFDIIDDYKTDISIIYDRFDNIIIASPWNGMHDFMGKMNWSNNGSRYFTMKNSAASDIFVITAFDTTSDLSFFYISSGILLFIIILLFLLVYIFSNEISDKLTREIDRLVTDIESFGNNEFHHKIQETDSYEFSLIARSINRMQGDLYESFNKNIELAKINHSIEIKQLEMQFNPHFIYNALESIRVTSFLDPNKTAQIINHLSRFLRYSIDQNIIFVTIEEDFGYIKDYFELQKIRFGDKLQYDIIIDDEILNISIPKLLLYSLVENSIKYGFLHKTELYIKIAIIKNNNDIIFTIFDNGEKIGDSIYTNIKTLLNSDTPIGNHFGLFNINRRLHLLYGPVFGISFGDDPNGNTFIVTIPDKVS
ncbi:histidine kinase [Bacteroidia bacterium]|nr:histidine kinase [Bacteroidia bacterium]